MSANNEAEVDLDAYFCKKDKKKKTKVITTEELFEKQCHAAKKSKKKSKQSDDEVRNVQSTLAQRTEEDDEWVDDSEKQSAENDMKKYENLKVKMVSTIDEADSDERLKKATSGRTDELAESERRAAASCWKIPANTAENDFKRPEDTISVRCLEQEKAVITVATVEDPAKDNKKGDGSILQSPKFEAPMSEEQKPSGGKDEMKSPAKTGESTADKDAEDTKKRGAYVPPHLRNKQATSTNANTSVSTSASATPASAATVVGSWRERERLKKEREDETKRLEPVRMGELRRGKQGATPDVQSAEEFPALSMGALKKEINAVAAATVVAQSQLESVTTTKKTSRRSRERTISLSEFNKQHGGHQDGDEAEDDERFSRDESPQRDDEAE